MDAEAHEMDLLLSDEDIPIDLDAAVASGSVSSLATDASAPPRDSFDGLPLEAAQGGSIYSPRVMARVQKSREVEAARVAAAEGIAAGRLAAGGGAIAAAAWLLWMLLVREGSGEASALSVAFALNGAVSAWLLALGVGALLRPPTGVWRRPEAAGVADGVVAVSSFHENEQPVAAGAAYADDVRYMLPYGWQYCMLVSWQVAVWLVTGVAYGSSMVVGMALAVLLAGPNVCGGLVWRYADAFAADQRAGVNFSGVRWFAGVVKSAHTNSALNWLLTANLARSGALGRRFGTALLALALAAAQMFLLSQSDAQLWRLADATVVTPSGELCLQDTVCANGDWWARSVLEQLEVTLAVLSYWLAPVTWVLALASLRHHYYAAKAHGLQGFLLVFPTVPPTTHCADARCDLNRHFGREFVENLRPTVPFVDEQAMVTKRSWLPSFLVFLFARWLLGACFEQLIAEGVPCKSDTWLHTTPATFAVDLRQAGAGCSLELACEPALGCEVRTPVSLTVKQNVMLRLSNVKLLNTELAWPAWKAAGKTGADHRVDYAFIASRHSLLVVAGELKGENVSVEAGDAYKPCDLLDQAAARSDEESFQTSYQSMEHRVIPRYTGGGTTVAQCETTVRDYGGGVFIDGGYLPASCSSCTTFSCNNCTFKNNRARKGGAIYNQRGSLTLSSPTFEGNKAFWRDNSTGTPMATGGDDVYCEDARGSGSSSTSTCDVGGGGGGALTCQAAAAQEKPAPASRCLDIAGHASNRHNQQLYGGDGEQCMNQVLACKGCKYCDST